MQSITGFSRSRNASTMIRVSLIPSRQFRQTGQANAIRTLFSTSISSTHLRPSSHARPSCRSKRECPNQWIRRSAFSTSSHLRSAEGENQQAEGTAPKGGKPVYPERLIVYHAGTAKTTLLACLKVTTLFIFGFFDMIMAPAYLAAGESFEKTATVAICGLIPPLFTALTTSTFVAAIHLHLPPYARHSRAILERFARTAPPNTRLDITTMSLIGKPRVSSMTLADLRPVHLVPSPKLQTRNRWLHKMGLVNYVRDTSLVDKGRKWWRFRAVSGFHVVDYEMGPEGDKRLKTGWVWPIVKGGIEKRAGVQGQ